MLLGFAYELAFGNLLPTIRKHMNDIVVIGRNELEELLKRVSAVGLQSTEAEGREHVFFDVNQAASFLNLARQTVYSMTSKRSIPFFKKGKKLYFRQADLEHWLLSGRKMTQDEIREHGLSKQVVKGGRK